MQIQRKLTAKTNLNTTRKTKTKTTKMTAMPKTKMVGLLFSMRAIIANQ